MTPAPVGVFDDLLPPPLPKRFSVSFIGATTECMLKARFDRETGFSGVFAAIGSAAHEVFATAEFKAQMGGLMRIHPRDAEDIAERVLRNSDERLPMTHGMHQQVVTQARVWAEKVDFPVDADEWVIEHPFRIPVWDEERGVEYTISGRMDEFAIWGTHYRNRDWKTGPGLPKQSDVEENHFQLPLYALAAFYEHPYLETFELVEFYTRRGIPRRVQLTRDDLPALERWLLARCRAITQAYTDGIFLPSPGERWCNVCPNPDACPEPEFTRPSSIITDEEAAKAEVRRWIVLEARAKKAKGAVKGFLEGRGEMATVEVGGKEYGFVPKTVTKMNDDRLGAILAEHGLVKGDLYDREPGQEFGVRAL